MTGTKIKTVTAKAKAKTAAKSKAKGPKRGPGAPGDDGDDSGDEWDFGDEGSDAGSGAGAVGYADPIGGGFDGPVRNSEDFHVCMWALCPFFLFSRGLWDVALNSSYVNVKFRTRSKTSLLPYG